MSLDLTDLGPTFICICGSNTFQTLVIWDEETRLPGAYEMNMSCYTCGAVCRAPTPIDGDDVDLD